MIKEAYCSFEVAKLLKEKGFPQQYIVYHSPVYNEEDYEHEYGTQRMSTQTKIIKAGTLSLYPLGVPEPKCYAPTHQMAMAWVREKGVCIEPYAAAYRFGFTLSKIPTGSHICNEADIYPNEEFETYEEATEAALKYCLEQLI